MRLLLVDSQTMLRHGLRLTLESIFDSLDIQEADGTKGGLEIAQQSDPYDVMLLNGGILDGNELDLVVEFKAAFPETPILVLIAAEASEDILKVIHAGARGCILTTQSPDVLQHVILLILSGETYVPASATGLLVDLPVAQNGRSIAAYAARKRGSGKVGLTPRQTEVLRLVAKGKSNKEVGRDLGMLEGTVKAHLRAVMQKLRVTNRTELAMRAARMGLVSDNHAP